MDEARREHLTKVRDELTKDFLAALDRIDFTAYDSSSFAFRCAESKGAMLMAVSALLDGEAGHGDAIDEELAGAEKYAGLYKATGKSIYREMAGDELKHAGYLIEEERAKGAGSERLAALKAKHDEIAGGV